MPPPCLLPANSIKWNRLNLPPESLFWRSLERKGHFALAFCWWPGIWEGGTHTMDKAIRSRHVGGRKSGNSRNGRFRRKATWEQEELTPGRPACFPEHQDTQCGQLQSSLHSERHVHVFAEVDAKLFSGGCVPSLGLPPSGEGVFRFILRCYV